MNWRYLQMIWRYLQIIWRYLQFIWRYLQILSIWRYLQLNWRYLQFIWRYLQIGRFEDIYNSFEDIYNSAAKVALVNKRLSLWASYIRQVVSLIIRRNSVLSPILLCVAVSKTSFTLVSIIIIIQNIINNKVYFLYSGLQLLINPFTWIIAQWFFRRGALIVSLLSIWRYLQMNWRYLQIRPIWRYIQFIWRYLQINCRYLQIGLIVDISNWFEDIFKWIGDICNWIADMCTSIGDIFNSVNKCENGAP